jgi:hypothetical protein
VVIIGYAAALFLASAAVYARQLHTQDALAQASAGMFAFWRLAPLSRRIGVTSLFPTGLALYFLRPCDRFRTALSSASVVYAATGFLAVLVMDFRSRGNPSAGWGFYRYYMAPTLCSVKWHAGFKQYPLNSS